MSLLTAIPQKATAAVAGIVTVTNGSSLVPGISLATGEILSAPSLTQQVPAWNGANFGTPVPSLVSYGQAAGPAAVRGQVGKVIVQSNLTGGTNEPNSVRYKAFKFNTGAFTELSGIAIRLNVSNTVVANTSLVGVLYADAAGSPGAVVGYNLFQSIAGDASGVMTLIASGDQLLPQVPVTANTDYWVVFDTNAIGVGNINFDVRTDTGANLVANASVLGTWTLDAGPKTAVMEVYAASAVGVIGASWAAPGGVFTSQIGPGVIATTYAGVGVSAFSNRFRALSAISNYGEAVFGQSTWSTGVHAITTQGTGLSVSVQGTLQANTANNAFNVTRTVVLNGFAVTGDLFSLNDVPSGGTSTANLFTLLNNNQTRYRIDYRGAAVANGLFTLNTLPLGNAMSAPSAPTLASSAASGGALTNGATYLYVSVPVNLAGTEGPPSAELSVAVPAGGTGTSGTATINIVSQFGIPAYNIYRTAANGLTGTEGTLAGTVFFNNTSPIAFADTGAGSVKTLPTAFVLAPHSRIGANTFAIFPWQATGANAAGGLNIGGSMFDNVSANKFVGSGSGTYFAINAHTGFTGNLEDLQQSGVSRWKLSATGLLTQTSADAVTNTQTIIDTRIHRTSGIPAANFGSMLKFQLDSNNNTVRDAAGITTLWVVATDATRTARTTISSYDSVGAREGFRVEASGTAPMTSVNGVAAVAKQVAAAAAVDAATTQTLANAIRTALINFGIWA